MLSIVGKGIRGGICHSVIWYTKANNKFMKDYDKNKESSYLRYWDGIIYTVGKCCKSVQ